MGAAWDAAHCGLGAVVPRVNPQTQAWLRPHVLWTGDVLLKDKPFVHLCFRIPADAVVNVVGTVIGRNHKREECNRSPQLTPC